MIGAHLVLLADNDTDKGSPLGLFLLLIIAVAVYFLWRSMNRHIKKLPANFSAPDEPVPEPPDPRIIVADTPSLSKETTPLSKETTPGTDEPDRP